MSVRNRLALILGSVLLPLLLATGVVVAVVVPTHVQGQTRASLRVVAQAVSAMQGQTCLDLASSARLVTGAVTEGQPAGKALQANLRPDVGFAAVSRSGALLARAGQAPPGLSATAPVAQQCAGEPVRPARFGAAVQSSLPAVLTFSNATSSPQGPLMVVTGVPLDQARLSSWRAEVGASERVMLSVACPGGGVASTVSGPARDAMTAAAALAIRGGAPTVQDTDVAVAQPGAGHPCAVVAGLPAPNTVVASALTWGLLLLALLAGAVLVWWLARQLTRPVLALTDAAERAAHGDLAVRLPVNGSDEVARLAESFNNMAGQLDQRLTEIAESRDRLRVNVQRLGDALQRTHDLDGLLSAVCGIAATATGSTRVTAWLSEGNSLVARVIWPAGAARGPVRRVPAAGNLPGLTVSDGVVRRVEAREPDDVTLREGPAMAAPLHRADSMLGALVVERPSGAEPYAVEDQAMLTSITGPAGIAIDNAMLHRQAQRMSVIDPLTGVGNLRMLTNTLAREVDRADHFNRSMSLLVLDIDHFKDLNDVHGHGAGDAILHAMASRVAASVRRVDTVARYGGEEFAVVCPELGPREAMEFAQHLWEAVRGEGFDIGGELVDVRVSLGVASWPQQATTSAELLRAADAALAEAKRRGRDRVAPATAAQR